MNTWTFVIKKLVEGIPLIIGVTLVSFTLMVYYGPDLTYSLLSKNADAEAISEIRQMLGYDLPFWQRYLAYMNELARFDFGLSMVKDQPVADMLSSAIPVSLLLMLPGFIIGNVLSIYLALKAAQYRGQWQDKTIMAFAVIGMSISFLIVIISFQQIFSSSYGLNWFPVRGWQIYDDNNSFMLLAYLKYVTVPTMAVVFRFTWV